MVAVRSVTIGPGAIAFTRTPLGVASQASARVKPMIAAFAAQYGVEFTAPLIPRWEATLMMQPRPRAAIAENPPGAIKNILLPSTSRIGWYPASVWLSIF